MRIWLYFWTILIWGSFGLRFVAGYPVGPSLELTAMEKEADLICKVEAGSPKPAEGSSYKSMPGFAPVDTEMHVIEVYKGTGVGEKIVFDHYASQKDGLPFHYMPQHYEVEPGQVYILFAKKTDRDGVYQQLWENHRAKEDQGLVRAADKTKHGAQPMREVLWSELNKWLASEHPQDVIYAIKQLDEMSGSGYAAVNDFDRAKTMAVIEPLVSNPNGEIATAAIAAIGSRNPYMPGFALGWLATFAKGNLPGIGACEETGKSPAAKYWKPLADVADSQRRPEVRALAIRALGRTSEPAVEDRLKRWLIDPAPAVRQAAAVLLADYPDLATDETIERLAKDKDPLPRAAVAQAIGLGQWTTRVKVLSELVQDADPNVTQAAAISLLSLPMSDTRATLEALADRSEYRPVFVNALAADNPQPYLDALVDIVRHDRRPEHWWGGLIPWGVSWEILFKFARSHPGEMRAGKLNNVLDALESPEYYSSSEPRDLYAMYLQQHMTKRANEFRASCRKRMTYDIDYFFKQVDQNPDSYRRE